MANPSPTRPVVPVPSTKPGGPDSPRREPGSSAGMAPVTPAQNPPPADATDKLREGAKGLALPHERDQSSDMTGTRPDPQVQQAGRDLERGLQDTGKSTPMDKTYDKLKR